MNTSLNRKSFLFKPDVQIVFKNLVEHLLSIAKSNFLMLFMEVVALYCRSHISFLVGSGLSTHCSCRWLLLCLITFRHTHTHTRELSSGRGIGPSPRPLPARHDVFKRRTSMPPAGFEPAIPGSKGQQTRSSDCAAARIGL
jgi:hypothetical protein